MKIKFRIDNGITKQELLERLPALIKAATESLLEKGVKLGEQIENGIWKSHPVRAIAASEDEIYDQGHEALSGIYSWLLRSLKIETNLTKGLLDKEKYRDQVLEGHGIELGSTVTFDQAKEIDEVLSLIPKEVLEAGVRLVSVDGRFGASRAKYPNHGRYYDESKKVVLNPNIFGDNTIYKDGKGKPVNKITQTLLHEVGHSIDDRNDLSGKKEWLEISEWKFIGLDGEPAEGHDRLILKDKNETTLKSRWAYKKGTCFPRWYGARNPKEDFCESFAFAMLGAKQYFVGETGKKKWDFVHQIIDKFQKSESPNSGLEARDDSEILKSQVFESYCDTRLPSLSDLDELDAIQKALDEFLTEPCEDICLEKAEPNNPTAGAHLGNLGPNPLKGQMKPGHKYLYRESMPDGSFKYYYEMPSGHHYFSHEALHEEGRHHPEIKSDTEWARRRQSMTAPEQMQEAKRGQGIETHHFDIPERPKIIDDIKPGPDAFNPNAAPKPVAEGQPEEKESPEGKPDWRHGKPKREERIFALSENDAKDNESALKTWAVEKIYEGWGEGGIQVKYRAKLKNDGDALVKPKSSALQFGRNQVRHEIDEHTTIYREVCAYAIDKILKWNLVPPTALRELKGQGSRIIEEAIKKDKGGDNPVYKAFSTKDMNEASLQAFAQGAIQFSKIEGKEHLKEIAQEEIMRFFIFDMIINHQDRHQNNLMVVRDPDSRYGKPWRFLLVDNGYSFGDGALENQRCYDEFGHMATGKVIDKKTLRDLRKLRDDIRDKRRRRKVIDHELRQNISEDQIQRVADRIDWLLGDSHRDKLGRVTLASWYDMNRWEKKNRPSKYSAPPEAEMNPFDITGKTAIVGKEAGAPAMFKDIGAVNDFLHPLLEHLVPRQKKYLDEALGYWKAGDKFNAAYQLREFVRVCPKRLVNQLFGKQLFARRMGFDKSKLRDIKARVENHLQRDFVSEFHDNLKARGPEYVNKLQRGELDEQAIKNIVGPNDFEKLQGRWALPKHLLGINKNKTERIFDDPAHFGWGEAPPVAEKSQGEPDLIVNL